MGDVVSEEQQAKTDDVVPTETPGPAGTGEESAASPFAGLLAEAQTDGDSEQTIGMPVPAPAQKRPASKTDGSPPEEAEKERKPTRILAKGDSQKPEKQRKEIGPYQVIEELGSGGMAVVYKAIQPALDRLVAIKELRSSYVHDKQISTRFEREAASLATLAHGNITHVYDFIRDDKSAHIIMEYVDGIDLFDLLELTHRLPAEVAAIFGLEVIKGLEYAHFRGIIHRDIKPSNIFISKRGEVKVMDFGIARDPGKSELTQIGLAVGTPAYMAPEQIRGEAIDFRADIFAFGIVLYELLAGEKPWTEEKGKNVALKVLQEPYQPLSERLDNIPADLSRIIDRCLEKDPKDRYLSTYSLRRDLEELVHRIVPADPRGRLVMYLCNRGVISDAEAKNLVTPELLADSAVRRRDENIPPPPAHMLLKPIVVAHAVGILAVVVAMALSPYLPFGKALAKDRPAVELKAGEKPPAGTKP